MIFQRANSKLWWRTAAVLWLVVGAWGEAAQASSQEAGPLVWDTLSPLADRVDVRDSDGWESVSPVTEKGYTSQGDLVVRNRFLTAVISAKRNRIFLHSQPSGKRRVALSPLNAGGLSPEITSCKVVGGPGDVAAVHLRFQDTGETASAVLSFGNTPVVSAEPQGDIQGFRLDGPIAYAIAPSFIGDDLIFDPGQYPPGPTLRVATDNVFVGLLGGNDGVLTVAWEEKQADISPILQTGQEEGDLFESVRVESRGGNIHFAVQEAPGIWYREALKPSYLERDVLVDWRRPYAARWKTQLLEDGVRTTYRLRSARRKRFWRGGVGTYTYPVWTQGDSTFYRLGKKIPPKGESVVYFLERTGDTPDSVLAPADIAKQVLNGEAYEGLLEFGGRKKTNDGRPDHCVGTATCGVTDKFKPIFEAGNEVDEMETIEGGIEDMVYHLSVLTERAHVYQAFAHETLAYLTAVKRNGAQATSFLDEMEGITLELIAAFEAQKENIRDLAYATELGRETHTLAQEKRPDNLPAFLKLKGRWTGMGGALEGLNRKQNTIARKLHQQAGYACATQPESVELAEELRGRVRKLLRNPNGYEIWAYD